jgi:hypothetical protein
MSKTDTFRGLQFHRREFHLMPEYRKLEKELKYSRVFVEFLVCDE